MSEREPRCELTAAQIDIVRTILTQLLPFGADGIGTHPEELLEARTALRAASDLLYRAAEKHRGQQPSWKQFCEALLLSPAVSRVQRGQDVLELLVGLVGIELVRGSGKKGDALPGFRVKNGAGRKSEENTENVKLCQSCSVFLYNPPCPRMAEYSGGACPDYLQPVPECCQTCFSTSDPRKPCPYKPEQDKDGNWVCEGWEYVPPEIRARFDKDDEQPAPANESPEPSCCAGCVSSCAQCVHSPEEDGECVGRETEPPAPASELEDLTALDGEPKGDEQPEVCSGCGRQYSTCGYQSRVDDCEGFTI